MIGNYKVSEACRCMVATFLMLRILFVEGHPATSHHCSKCFLSGYKLVETGVLKTAISSRKSCFDSNWLSSISRFRVILISESVDLIYGESRSSSRLGYLLQTEARSAICSSERGTSFSRSSSSMFMKSAMSNTLAR